MNFFDQIILDNSVGNYSKFLLAIIIAIASQKIVVRIVAKILFKIFNIDDKHGYYHHFQQTLSLPIRLLLIVLVVYFASYWLRYPKILKFEIDLFNIQMRTFSGCLFKSLLLMAITWIIIGIVDFGAYRLAAIDDRYNKIPKTPLSFSQFVYNNDNQIVFLIRNIARFFIIVISFLFALKVVFKYDISALLTGLGVGGLAIALAAKETLENLFACLTIFLEHSFSVGDMILVDNIQGKVEHVGFRCTRMRTLDKSYLTIPNKKLVDFPLNNLSLRTLRRLKFDILIAHTTNQNNVQNWLDDIRIILQKEEHLTKEWHCGVTTIDSKGVTIMIECFFDNIPFELFFERRQDVTQQIWNLALQYAIEFAESNESSKH